VKKFMTPPFSEDEELTWENKPAEDWKKLDVENCFQMCSSAYFSTGLIPPW